MNKSRLKMSPDESWKQGLCASCVVREECFERAGDPEGYGYVKGCSAYKPGKAKESE